jgi:hypothetical protein
MELSLKKVPQGRQHPDSVLCDCEHRHRKDRAGHAPHPIPEDQSNNHKEGIERETPRQQHGRYGFAFGKVN